MSSSHQPEPFGKRKDPPPHLRVGLGQFDGPGEKVVMIVVDDAAESAALELAFERRGWEVRVADDMIDAFACTDQEGVSLVIADDFEVIKALHPRHDNALRPVFVALFKWHEDTWRYAQEAGADIPLPRPLDRDDPLKLWQL